MKLKNRGIIIGVVAFLILLSIDLASTLLLGDLIQYLEVNPLYKYIGLFGIVLLNIGIVVALYFLYQKSQSIRYRFIWLNLLVTLILTRVLVVINNIEVFLSSPTVEMAMSVTPEMKAKTVTSLFGKIFVPYLIAIFTFFLFQLDHFISRK